MKMSSTSLDFWFTKHPFGHYISRLEQKFLSSKLKIQPNQTFLQLGRPDWLLCSASAHSGQYIIQSSCFHKNSQIIAADFNLPWATHSIDTIIWPHGIDQLNTANQAIAEIERILIPGGQLLLSGFNRLGYWRLFFGHHQALRSCHFHDISQLTRLLQQHHFILNEGKFLGYQLGNKRNGQKVEFMGNRWWPHLAAAYVLILDKKTIPLTPIKAGRDSLSPNDVLELNYSATTIKE